MSLCYERNISNYTKSRISLLTEKKSLEKNLKMMEKLEFIFMEKIYYINLLIKKYLMRKK